MSELRHGTQPTALSVGDRVEIVNRAHPWFGRLGHIIDGYAAAGLDWTVQVENGDFPGHWTACANSDLRSRPRGI